MLSGSLASPPSYPSKERPYRDFCRDQSGVLGLILGSPFSIILAFLLSSSPLPLLVPLVDVFLFPDLISKIPENTEMGGDILGNLHV